MKINPIASALISALAFIRAWKNRTFSDWLFDLLVGLVLGLIGLLTNIPYLILAIPFAVTVVNQFYNKLFEPKDFALRMAFPMVIWVCKLLINN
jgi:uncharacterized membrane protein AbrB (regulator of aidB expression)